MDKSLKILKRKRASNMRLRKVNNVYDRILQGRIRFLDSNFRQVKKELMKETKYLEEEIKDFRPEQIELPPLKQATTPPSSSQSGALSRGSSRSSDRGTSRKKVSQTCFVDPTNSSGRCRHFPCCLPVTYNSLGLFPKPQTYSRISNYGTLIQRCGDLRPPTSLRRQATEERPVAETTEQISHAPRTTTKEKIRGLQHLVREMRARNEQTKPRDWATNYGDPVPRRILLNPVKV